MASSKHLVALDIGSSKIRVLIGICEEKKNTINIIGVGISPSSGIRKGMITDIEEAALSVTSALEDAERMSGEIIHRLFVGISGPYVETYDSKGVIAINGNHSEISEEDVERVLDAAQTVSLPSNREILRTIPKCFSVDSQKNIKYPVGMTGIRLEVEAHMITGQLSAIRNIEKCLDQTGIDIQEIIPSSLACAESILDRRQKELGVALVEIGAVVTNIIVFEEGTAIHSSIIPIGGEHVTNDLAIGLKCTIDTAEKIKIDHGTCLTTEITEREEIDLSQLSKSDTHSVATKQVTKIVEARYHEIFMMVRDELTKINRDGILPGGVVLCGGAIKIAGCSDLARSVLSLPIQIGFPRDIEGITDKVDDPSFAQLTGLLHFANRYGESTSFWDFLKFDKIFGKVANWFKALVS